MSSGEVTFLQLYESVFKCDEDLFITLWNVHKARAYCQGSPGPCPFLFFSEEGKQKDIVTNMTGQS
jgi:hypothetical protein